MSRFCSASNRRPPNPTAVSKQSSHLIQPRKDTHLNTTSAIRRLTPAEGDSISYGLFGTGFRNVDALARDTAEELSPDFLDGPWDRFIVSRRGFYMAPQRPKKFRIFCANDFEDTVSAQAFGVLVCLKTYILLSHYPARHLAKRCAVHLRLLCCYARTLREAKEIRAALA